MNIVEHAKKLYIYNYKTLKEKLIPIQNNFLHQVSTKLTRE
jgi:hypothetical protein